jgi:hypothetical protein
MGKKTSLERLTVGEGVVCMKNTGQESLGKVYSGQGGGGGDGEDVHVPVHRQHCQDGWSKEVRPINQPEEENSTYNSLLVDKWQ